MTNTDIEEIIRENICKSLHLSLATVSENGPWVSEVHFAYDDNLRIYFRSKQSRRHSKEIEADSRVAGNIVRQHELDDPVLGVYFEGEAKRLENVTESHPAYVSMESRLGLKIEAIKDASQPDGHSFYEIIVSNWYVFGRFGADHGQKLKLEWN